MRCVVTGAAGFVGSTLCDRLLRDGHDVVGLDCFVDYYARAVKESNLTLARENPRFSFVEESLLSVDLERLLDGVDWVFHQAGQAGVRASWGSQFESYLQHNIQATQRLLEHVRSGVPLKKLVFASSSSVYGNAESFPTSELVLPRPVSPYGVTKLAAEHLMCLYATEFSVPTVSLRYFTVYGPRQRPDMAFNRFIRAGLLGESLLLYGDGTQSRDFTYIDDIVSANILAAERGTPGSVFNIGGGNQVTVNEVLDYIGKEIGPLKIKREERQSGDAKMTGADTSRAQRDLGFKPTVHIWDGIKREIDWMRTCLA